MRAGANPALNSLIDREREHIRATLAGFPAGIASPRDALGALLSLLVIRQRYFALVGEHFSVFDLDGITAMDTLDDALLTSAAELLRRRPEAPADESAERELGDAVAALRPPERHAVAYEVLYHLRRVFETFDGLMDRKSDGRSEEGFRATAARYEAAFLKRAALVVNEFVSSRTTPIVRHFAEINREHKVVERLHCACGQSRFEVKRQSLVTGAAGEHLDRLDVACGACGATRSIDFPLPYFGDLTIATDPGRRE
jgi:hypothetical protein